MQIPSNRSIRRPRALWLALPCWMSCIVAAFAAEFPAGWRNVQLVTIDRPGLVKISVPLESLTSARGQYDDLRLLDAKGSEVPYLLERPSPPQARRVSVKRFTASVQAEATVIELETGVTQAVAAVRLLSPAPDFLKAVRVEASQDQRGWRVLAEGQAAFRQRNGAEQLGIGFSAGPWRHLRLIVDDRRSGPVPFTGAELEVEAGAPAPVEPLAIAVESRVEETGETRVQLRTAGANVILAGLRIETPEPFFMRAVGLSHPRFVDGEVQQAVFARDTIFRTTAEDGAVSEKLSVASEVALVASEIVLTIKNEDNPPLRIARVTAMRRPVHLVFHASAAGEYALLTGNAESAAPRYELASLRTSLQGAPLIEIRAGPLATNPAYRAEDPLAVIPSEGSALEVSDWAFRKRVQVAEDGLQQLELDLPVLAQAEPSFADLRLIRDGRQVPYVLERLPGLRTLAPPVSKADDPARPRISRWLIELPEPSLPLRRLTCTTPAAYFERSVRLMEERRDMRGSTQPVTLASASWSRRNEAKAAPLVLAIDSRPETARLFLEIDNGDNPPLPFDRVEVAHATVRILFKASKASELFLYYGNATATAPRYDMAAAMPRVLSAPRIQASLAAEEVLKPSRQSGQGGRAAGWLFWSVLVAVVAGLLLIVARLLPKPAGGAGPAPDP